MPLYAESSHFCLNEALTQLSVRVSGLEVQRPVSSEIGKVSGACLMADLSIACFGSKRDIQIAW